MNKIKVLMLGPARNTKGGMAAVIDQYYQYGLDKKVDLKYIETVNDKGTISKALKMVKGYIEFVLNYKKYDIIHLNMASRLSTFRKIMYLKKAKKKNKKVFIHIHSGQYKEFYENCNEKQKKQIKEALNLADKVIVLSEEWKEYFSTLVNEEKMEIIYNSIVIPEKFEKNLDTLDFLFLGVTVERKGVYDIVDVIGRLKEKYPQIHLYIGGEGENDKIQNIINEKNLNDNIKLLGWVVKEDKEKYLKECSFFVLPSYYEGMPMSVIEAMAYQNVAISTQVGGIPKVITNGENGILIPPRDREELYKVIEKLINDKELRIKLSKNARKTVEEKFNIENNINKLIALYINK